MKGTIRTKIVLYFLILSMLTIFVFEIYAMYSLRYYYYSTLSGVMTNQIRYSADIYSTYLADYSLDDVVIQDKDQFYRQVEYQVQILNNSGVVLYDSIASPQIGKIVESADVEQSKKGEEGHFIGNAPGTGTHIMCVSKPLLTRGEQIGIVRLISSLEPVDHVILNSCIAFLAFGVIALLLTIVVSFIMASTIVKPIVALTGVARKLSDGKLNVRADENDHDEIGVLGKTLNIMTDNIKEKEQIKNDFISSVSHELRTPLTAIIGWTKTLEYDLSDTAMLEEGLPIIERECTRLSEMVEDLLDFSRFTTGRIKIEKEPFDCTQLIIDTVKQLKPRSITLGIDLMANYEKEHLLIEADRSRIHQVLINLVDNAIKFTEKGGVVMVNIHDQDRFVAIEVIDTGVGIDEKEIGLVTQKFYKGNNSNSHTGLGLSICEEIVKLHDGEMQIRSALSQGTTVTVRLPKGDVDEI